MIADEIRALLLIHGRLSAWERPFIRDMARFTRLRRCGRHRTGDPQLTLLAEPVTRVVEALQPTRLVQPARAKKRAKRKQNCAARSGSRSIGVDAAAPLVDDPLPW